MTSRPGSGISELPDEVAGAVVALAMAGAAAVAGGPSGIGDGIGDADSDSDGDADSDGRNPGRSSAAGAIGGAAGEACRAALQELAALTRAERAQAIARLVRQVGAPIPDGIEAVHPGWLRAALEGEATEVLVILLDRVPEVVRNVAREIVEGRGEAWPVADGHGHEQVHDSAVSDLRRAVFAGFASMRSPSVASSLDQLVRAGAGTLGASLAGAPPAAIARAAAQAGTRELAELVIAAARGAVSSPDRDRARDVVAAAASVSADGRIEPLQAVGLVQLARDLGGALPSVVRASAQRLPIALGKVLLDLQTQ